MNRRDVLLAGGAVAAGTALGGMSGCPQNIDVISTVEQLIQKVQEGVVAACAAVGKFVPTVPTIRSIIEGLLGAVLDTTNLGKAITLITQAVTMISAVCLAPAPPTTSFAVSVGGKNIPVVFY